MKGKFIVFEGVDGSGKSTQISKLADYIRQLDKYQEVILIREPTRHATGIIKRLQTDKDAFSGGDFLTQAFVEDRRNHVNEIIEYVLDKGVDVLCDRFSMSTCAYQQTQGVALQDILAKHEGIISPDQTFYLNVSPDVALKRISGRAEGQEKFERREFLDKLFNAYRDLINSNANSVRKVLGQISFIDGSNSIERVHEDIKFEYDRRWK